MSGNFTESVVEQAALAWLESVGWSVRHGPETAPGESGAERTEDGLVVPALVKGSPERFRAASSGKIES
ncbi:MAG: hypothetical protein A3G81_30580 [Betaproteobacteria bacterium RIFCSPLOWO2_12_FULL_65_14]|nr:MAG: hypothetical protein A3G81_30580 [Betaproteobacteria bacterium RIFCSPLOWO2_12_FULL_65_14]